MVGYTYDGKETQNFEKDCFAKKISGGEIDVYFVKLGEWGNYANRILNPYDLDYFRRTTYIFLKVKKEVFDTYLRFLETHNIIHLLQAERIL